MPKSPSTSLKIATVPVIGKAVIGLLACPGRMQINADGEQIQGHLEADLNMLEDWGAEILISLVETEEFSKLGVPEFETVMCSKNLRWYHLPIADMGIPGAAFFNAWHKHGSDILKTIKQDGRVAIHCAGGLGRSGMIAAKLVTVFDTAPVDAIKQIRKARPGAIETREQENYVLNGPALVLAPL